MPSTNAFLPKHIPDVESQNKSINTLQSDEFIIYDVKDGTTHKILMHLSLLSQEWKSLLRLHFIAMCGGYVDSKNTIRSRINTCKGRAEVVRIVASYIHQYSPDKPLTQWDFDDVSDLIRKATFIEIELMDKDQDKAHTSRELLPFKSVDSLKSFFNKSHEYYNQGVVSSGFTENLPTYFVKKSVENIFEERGICFSTWEKGGTHGSVPTHIAMMMVAEAIKTLRSYETKLAITYFNLMRTNKHAKALNIREIWEGYEIFNGENKLCIGRKLLYKALNTVVKPKGITELPKWSRVDFNNVCEEIHQASLVIFLCLTGVRISELVTVDGRYYRKETDGCWTFDSRLEKTNHGISEVRTMAGLVAEACDALMAVSYIDKSKADTTLFSPHYRGNYLKVAQSGSSKIPQIKRPVTFNRTQLSKAYQKLIDKYGHHILAECPKVTPHMFRHTFAEFTIRRFDGDVLEAIRQHYRHAAGSYFTMRYAGNKLKPEVEERIEKAYLKEILMKFSDLKFEDDFVGKAALKIKQIVRAQTHTASPEKIAEIIENLSDEIEGITPHSYGVCVAFKDQMHLAKCKNPKSGLPEYDNGSFDICPGCPNHLSNKLSNKENIVQMVISHKDFLANYPLKSSKAVKISTQAIENGERILKEMEQ